MKRTTLTLPDKIWEVIDKKASNNFLSNASMLKNIVAQGLIYMGEDENKIR